MDSKLTRPLIGAGRTGTMLAQIPDGINGLVPVTPFDAQHPFVQPLHVFGFEGGDAHVVSKTGLTMSTLYRTPADCTTGLTI